MRNCNKNNGRERFRLSAVLVLGLISEFCLKEIRAAGLTESQIVDAEHEVKTRWPEATWPVEIEKEKARRLEDKIARYKANMSGHSYGWHVKYHCCKDNWVKRGPERFSGCEWL